MNKHIRLFNTIAPVYGWFHNWQKKFYRTVLAEAQTSIDLSRFNSILDVGCGTGALCSVLFEQGFSVTGIDPPERMLTVARKLSPKEITFINASAVAGLPFPDNHFEVAIASYVAHGLPKEERLRMYAEMSRVSRHLVIIHDYSQKRSILTSIVEWLERGDYFNFIISPTSDLRDCSNADIACFSTVTTIPIGEKTAWYVGNSR